MEYRFEEQQSVRFELYDIDKPSEKLTDHDFLGFAECTLVLHLPQSRHAYVSMSKLSLFDELGSNCVCWC